MVYGLARAAAGAFIRGAAGSLGRRLGSYRRRRRYRYVSKQRAGNLRRARVYSKRIRSYTSSKGMRRLWRAVRALQRSSDPDVSLRDITPQERQIDNNPDGATRYYVDNMNEELEESL